MKLVILAAAVIVAQSINNPDWMSENKIAIALFAITVTAWECYDIWNKNKKQ